MFWTTAAYAMGAAPQGEQGAAAGFAGMMPILLMIGIFYFLLIRPQQKKAKEHRAMLSALKRGDRVVTAGGLYGRILEVGEETITVDLGNSTVIVGRGFVSTVIPAGGKAAPETGKGKKSDAKGKADAKAVAPAVEEAKADAEVAAGTDSEVEAEANPKAGAGSAEKAE